MFEARKPLYDFVDDCEGDPLEGVAPLPRAVPIREIPAAERLSDLTEDRSNAEAFYIWAQERMGAFEFLQKFRAVEHLSEVASVIGEHWFQHGSMVEVEGNRRKMLAPFAESRLTMRQIAVATNLPLAEVVGTLFAANSRPKAEAMARLEEELLAGALEWKSASALEREYGCAHKTIAKLLDRHGIDCRAAERGRAQTPEERRDRRRAAAAAKHRARVKPTPSLRETV